MQPKKRCARLRPTSGRNQHAAIFSRQLAFGSPGGVDGLLERAGFIRSSRRTPVASNCSLIRSYSNSGCNPVRTTVPRHWPLSPLAAGLQLVAALLTPLTANNLLSTSINHAVQAFFNVQFLHQTLNGRWFADID